MSVFGNIIKGILIGAGTVLSIIPSVGPLIGAPIVSLGEAIGQSSDTVSNASVVVAAKVNTTSGVAAGTGGGLLAWLQLNWYIPLLVIAGLFLLFKKRR